MAIEIDFKFHGFHEEKRDTPTFAKVELPL